MSAAAVQLATKRTQEKRYKTWSPPQSSITVEYSDDLLREVRLTGLLGDASGVLYGIRDGQGIRVTAARRALNEGGFQGDPRLAGLEPVGIFSARVRGEIFLTESDLKHLEQSEGTIALVVAGSKAGFFLYEADGSIETIKSHAEFRLSGEENRAKLALPATVEPPRFAIEGARVSAWVWLLPVAVLSVVALFATQSFWLPRPPLLLTAHDQDGQVRIAWNGVAATAQGTELEIADGDAHLSVPIPPEVTSATYVRRTSDVRIHLTAGGHTETLRFFGADMPLTPIDAAHQRVNDLDSEAQTLDAALERGTRQIKRLETEINALAPASR